MCKMIALLLRMRTLKFGGVRNSPSSDHYLSNPKPSLASTMANLTDVTILPKVDPGRFHSSF